jgi:hypothetical protein
MKDFLANWKEVVFSWLMIIGSIAVAVLAYHAGDHYMHWLGNSDALYLPTLFKDIFAHGGSIHDWHLTPAPYFLPDYLLYLFAYFLGPTLFDQIWVYFSLQIFVLSLCLLYLFKQIQLIRRPHLAVAAIIVTLVYFALTAFSPYIYMLNSAFHFGGMLLSVLLVALWLNHAKATNQAVKSSLLWLTYALLCVSVLSDSLLMIQAAIPLCVVVFYYSLTQTESKLKANIYSVAKILLAGVLGYALYPLIVTYSTRYHPGISFGRLPANLSTLVTIFTGGGLIPRILVYLFFIGYVLTIIKVIAKITQSKRKSEVSINWDMLIIYTLVAFGLSLLSCLLLSKIDVTDRYLIPVFIFPVIVSYLFLATRLKKYLVSVLAFLICVFMVLSIFCLIGRLNKSGFSGGYYPEKVACVDKVLAKYNVHNGIAEYWDAKYTQGWSKLDLRVAAFQPNLMPFERVNSDIDYRSQYDFAIVPNAVDSNNPAMLDKIIHLSGAPLERFECGTKEVVVYKPNALQVLKIKDIGDEYTWTACMLDGFVACENGVGARLASRSARGVITYGPYVSLPAGKYEFLINYSSPASGKVVVGKWSVKVSSIGVNKRLKRGKIVGSNGRTSVLTQKFSLARRYDLKMIQVKIYKNKGYSFQINSLLIKRLG